MRNDETARKKISDSLKRAYREGRRKPVCLKGEANGFYGKFHSFESKKKMGLRGRTPWNKGKKGIMVAWNKGKKLPYQTWNKGKNLPNQSGNKHHGWIEDRSKLKTDRRHAYDSKYKIWMRSVKNRDGWKCRTANQECSGRLVAHHILAWRAHPELRYEVNNGITLCHFHHPRKTKDEMRLAPYFMKLATIRVN